MFSWYKYLVVNLVFSYLGFWSGNLFLIAPFPDLCLLVPFNTIVNQKQFSTIIKAKLINRFKENITNTLIKCTETKEGKLRTYAIFKTIFQKEKYLSVIQDVSIRKCFMSFTISSHLIN